MVYIKKLKKPGEKPETRGRPRKDTSPSPPKKKRRLDPISAKKETPKPPKSMDQKKKTIEKTGSPRKETPKTSKIVDPKEGTSEKVGSPSNEKPKTSKTVDSKEKTAEKVMPSKKEKEIGKKPTKIEPSTSKSAVKGEKKKAKPKDSIESTSFDEKRMQSDDDLERAELITKPPEEHLDIVIKAFEKIKEEYSAIQRNEGLSVWNSAMVKARRNGLDQVNRFRRTAKRLEPSSLFPKTQSFDDTDKPKIPPIILPRLEELPRKMMWTHTEKNIQGENEFHLTHIPFIGDTNEELEFGHYLLPFFPEGIHGVRHGLSEYINDWMLNRLYKSLSSKFSNEEALFAAIYYLFPNKLPPSQLKEHVPDLEGRLFGASPPKQRKNAEEKTVAYAETMKFLLCPRCCLFDCKKHDPSHDWLVDRVFPDKPNDDLVKGSCGKDCYKMITGSPKKRTPFNPNESLGRYTCDTAERLGGSNMSCLVTKVITSVASTLGHQGLPPTCVQIHDFLLRRNVPAEVVNESKAKSYKQIEEAIIRFRNTRYRLKLKVQHKHKIVPCDHPGRPCEVETCNCLRDDGICTKFCKCEDCAHKFPGCLCKGSCQTLACHCFKANIECDPDTCLNCGVDDLCGSSGHTCSNIQLTRSYRKRTEIKLSSIPQAGYGLFLLEPAKKEELISEYTGEIIETDESDRRGKIYDRIHLSYQFGMNEEETCDAFRIGNAIRFANHLKNPNCKTKIVLVNAEHRIGIYAMRDLEAGEELFFDYAYNELEGRKFVDKKTVPTNNKAKTKAN